MGVPASSSRRVRTGLFETDVDTGDVHREGRRISLQEQPFRVLAMLLERPGEVVTREELQARLWPADTFVGFDEGINTAIRKLRIAFGDSADNPRFIRRFLGGDTVLSRLWTGYFQRHLPPVVPLPPLISQGRFRGLWRNTFG